MGVTVLVQGTVRGTTTDAEGFFSIKAKHGDVLTFSFIGYTGKEYRVNKSVANLSIAMEEELTSIDQVVVTGMTSQQRKHIAASVGAVAPSNFENKPITRLSQALQGGTTGILVTQSSGLPGGDGATIKIRGVASLLGSDPLVLVDGFEFDMDKLDPSTVESVSILKDAAAASIYGAKAGNGVILITTKRGSAGKVSVSYNGYFGIQQPIYLPDFVDGATYMEYINEANRNTTGVDKYTPEQIRITREGSDPIHYPSTDWMKETMRETAPIHEHNFTVSGGNTTARFALSAQYLNQDGMYKVMDNGFERLTVRANTTVNLNKDIMMFVDMFVGRDTQRQPETMNKTILDYIYLAPPTLVSKYPRKEGQKPGYDYYGVYFEWMNPLANLERGTQVESVRDYVTINARPTWHIIPGLTLKGQVGYRIASGMDKKDRNAYVFLDYFSGNESGTFGAVKSATYTTRTSYWMVGATLDWTKEFGNHRINILGGWNEEVDRRNGWDDVALLSFFGKAYYSYKDKYLAEVGIRRDGSSLFGDGHKWGNFPSVAVGWNVNREPWMQNARFIDNFKIRASYGQLGNQNIGSNYPTIQQLDVSSISVNDVITPIVTQTTLANPDITWESTEMYDVGIDATLFDKLSVTADWYYKKTHDILLTLDIPSIIGLGAPYQNAGTVRNVGWEVAVGYHNKWRDFSFGVEANLSDVVNKIIDMKGTTGGSGAIRNQEGSAINSIYGLKCVGMARTQEEADWVNENCPQYGVTTKPGDLIYADMDDSGTIDDKDMTIIGSTVPRYTYGVNLSFGWKGLNLSAFFQGVGKVDGYLSSYYVQPCQQGGTFRKEHLDRWNETNPNGKYPRLTMTDANNWKQSSFWMRSAAYCRLKNIQLSYTLPRTWLKKLRMKSAMVFVNAQNLFTITDFYQGFDPEVAYSGSGDGVELGAVAYNYPQVKVVTMGVELKF